MPRFVDAEDPAAARAAINAEVAGASKDMDDITDATTVGKAVARAITRTAARAAIDAVGVDEIEAEVAAAIALDSTPADAAAAAVGDAVDEVISSRWATLETEGDWVAAGIGPMGEFWWGVHADGTVEVESQTVGGATTAQESVDDLLWAPVVFSDNTYAEIHVDKNGRVQDWALRAWADRMAVSGTVHVLIGMGQSNMSGRGLPIGVEIDPPHPRIYQYGANGSEITTATVPLDSVDAAYGISPLTLIAREYLKRLPENDAVLLIPAARGGTPLGAADDEHANGVWNAAYTGESTDLYGLAKTQITAALAAAETRWPDSAIRVAGMFWHQGEGNPSTSQSDYANRFDAIVTDLRSHVSDSDMPVVVGGMVPEWVESNGNLDAVLAAHVDTPNRVLRTGYAIPPLNGGGNLNLTSDDIVHFHRAGLEELSRRMLTAWDRALRNTEASVPHPPAVVSATVNDTVLTVEWSQPMCRYESFTVEYTDDDGDTWDEITHTTVDTTATETVASVPIMVRVSTTNDVGTSEPSTPVYAVTIKEPS